MVIWMALWMALALAFNFTFRSQRGRKEIENRDMDGKYHIVSSFILLSAAEKTNNGVRWDQWLFIFFSLSDFYDLAIFRRISVSDKDNYYHLASYLCEDHRQKCTHPHSFWGMFWSIESNNQIIPNESSSYSGKKESSLRHALEVAEWIVV